MPQGYLVAHLRAKDHADYIQRYGTNVVPVLEKYQGKILVASPSAKVEEGVSDENWTVIIQFPSLQLAEEFYRSPTYAPLKKLRTDDLTTSGTVILVEGFD